MSRSADNSNREQVVYRLEIVTRVLIAIVGGYVFALGAGIFMSQVLPATKSGAVMTASLASFAFYAMAIIWVFSVKNLRSIWLGFAGSALLLSSALFLFD